MLEYAVTFGEESIMNIEEIMKPYFDKKEEIEKFCRIYIVKSIFKEKNEDFFLYKRKWSVEEQYFYYI